MKRFGVGLLLSVLLFVTLFSAYPAKKAEAQSFAAACASILGIRAEGRAEAAAAASTAAAGAVMVTDIVQSQYVGGSEASNASATYKEGCMDAIFYIIAKLVISSMTQSIVNWINSGFQGSPSFISNPGQFFADIANEQFVDFMKTVFPNTAGILDFFCSPNLAFDLKLKFYLRYSFQGREAYKPECTVTDIIDNVSGLTKSVDEFVDGNFSGAGGWDRWIEVTQTPSNNGFGLGYEIESQFLKKLVSAIGQEQTVADWGAGFNSITKKAADGLNQIVMPGKAIENVLADTLGSPIRQLELADEFNEIVGALMGQLINQVISKGIGGLSSSGSGSSGRSFADDLGDEGENCHSDNQDDCYNAQAGGIATTTGQLGVTSPTSTANAAGQNLATGGRAYMPTYDDSQNNAEAAIDGRTGSRDDYSNAISGRQVRPYWQVEMRESFDIGTIDIWPTPERGDPIGNAYLFISDEPFTGDFNSILNNPEVRAIQINGNISNPPLSIPVNQRAKYIRIQRTETNERILALVEVFVNAPEEND
ncbi:MAG TPA: hypothetical protein PLF31_02005 [Candidatus Paceibacterota bacterium]|nr:hypothetical protein [Candidatus Paceibacterota bacterium]